MAAIDLRAAPAATRRFPNDDPTARDETTEVMAHQPRNKAEPSAHPLESHPEYSTAIGMVSLEAVALETRLGTLLARMLALPPRIGHAIYLSPHAEHARLTANAFVNLTEAIQMTTEHGAS